MILSTFSDFAYLEKITIKVKKIIGYDLIFFFFISMHQFMDEKQNFEQTQTLAHYKLIGVKSDSKVKIKTIKIKKKMKNQR